MSNGLDSIIKKIKDSDRILITSHENPDGDAIGSMLGLGLGLERIGKDIVLYNKDGVPGFLQFLPGSGKVLTSLSKVEGSFDISIAVDCTGPDRAGQVFEEYIKTDNAGDLIIIDHHQTNSLSADYLFVDPEASSTGMIIYDILNKLSVSIDRAIAESLYTTIVGDTGSFRYSNTSPETFRVAAVLLEAGADPEMISQALYESESPKKLKLLGLVLATLKVEDNKRIATVFVDENMYRQTDTNRQDTEGLVNIPRSIDGVDVAVLFRQESGNGKLKWKISLRSKGKFDVASIAEHYGGGGHRNAAGCMISGQLADVKSQILKSINEALL